MISATCLGHSHNTLLEMAATRIRVMSLNLRGGIKTPGVKPEGICVESINSNELIKSARSASLMGSLRTIIAQRFMASMTDSCPKLYSTMTCCAPCISAKRWMSTCTPACKELQWISNNWDFCGGGLDRAWVRLL